MSLLRAELALAKTPTVPFLPKPSMETPRISAALRLSKRCQPPRSGAVVRDYHGQGSQTRVDRATLPLCAFMRPRVSWARSKCRIRQVPAHPPRRCDNPSDMANRHD